MPTGDGEGVETIPSTRAPSWMRNAFVAVAALYLILGAVSSIWISQARFDDPLTFGYGQLWNALDPGALYYSDTVLFFSRSPIEHYSHPGLSMTFTAGTVARVVATILGDRGDDYLVDVVVHNRAYFALFSFLSCLVFLAGCQPLFLIARRFHSEAFAWTACSIWLMSIPVVLFANRFSPEPYMLLFGFWSLELTFRSFESSGWRIWPAMGASTVLSVLSKPLMMPVVILNVFAIIRAGREEAGTRTVLWRSVAWSLPVLAIGGLALLKLPLANFLTARAQVYAAGTNGLGFFDLLRTHHEAPLVGAHAVLFGLALGGILIRLLSGERKPRVDLALLFLLVAIVAMIARKPFWQYYFAFSWILMFYAIAVVVWCIVRLRRIEDNLAVAGGGLLAFLLVWGWTYPGLYSPFKHMHDRWVERTDAAANGPVAGPAIWEKRVGDSDLSEIWNVRSEKLEKVLMRLRETSRPGSEAQSD